MTGGKMKASQPTNIPGPTPPTHTRTTTTIRSDYATNCHYFYLRHLAHVSHRSQLIPLPIECHTPPVLPPHVSHFQPFT